MKIDLNKGRSRFWSLAKPSKRIALLAIVGTTSVLAQSGRSVIAQQLNCDRPQGDVEVRACIRLRYELADKRLNDVYKQLIAKLNGEEKALLSEAQLGWIKLRDKTCEFEVYRNRGGTGYQGFLNECLERMTKQRTAELEKYLQR
ncbi:MAG: lysozyme inhibitor LprI family protein [Microcoleus sp.]